MTIAHSKPAYHARRAAIWAVLAATPWVLLVFSGDMSELGRGWGAAALASPLALALSAKEFWSAVAGRTRVVWVDGDVIASDRFRKPRADLASVRAERRRPRFGIWAEEFIIFEFRDGTTVRILAKRLLEPSDAIVRAGSALTR